MVAACGCQAILAQRSPPHRAAGAYGAGTETFFGDFSHFVRCELSARSEDALDALQGRVCSKLPALARYVGPLSGPLRAEACMASFDAPEAAQEEGGAAVAEEGGEGDAAAAGGAPEGQAAAPAEEGGDAGAAGGGQHRCLFFVGVAEKEVRRAAQGGCCLALVAGLAGRPCMIHPLHASTCCFKM